MGSTYYETAVRVAGQPHFIKKNIVVPKSLSFKYLKYRILRPLLKVYNKILKAGLREKTPWISPACIRILNSILIKKMKGLEYGSGISTIYFARKTGNLVSIEHDKIWHEHIRTLLAKSKLSNVNYILISPDRPESKKKIENRCKAEFDSENMNYKAYFEYMSSFPENHFDFILIDGRARVECSRRAIDILKSGGIFILDNSERTRYKPVHDMLNGWQKVHTTTGLTDTTIWFKPL